jgi:hypothetical protein
MLSETTQGVRGVPLTIGWKYESKNTVNIDYEFLRLQTKPT